MDRKALVTKAVEPFMPKALAQSQKASQRFRLEAARQKLGGAGKHIGAIKELIETPEMYSEKQWEKVRTSLEWMARNLRDVVERMEELRPLTMVEDKPNEEKVA